MGKFYSFLRKHKYDATKVKSERGYERLDMYFLERAGCKGVLLASFLGDRESWSVEIDAWKVIWKCELELRNTCTGFRG